MSICWIELLALGFTIWKLEVIGMENGGCVGWSKATCGAGWVHTSSSAEYHCSWHWLDSNSSRAKRRQEHGTSGNLLRALVVLVWFSLGLVASPFFSIICLTSNFVGFFSIPPIHQFNSFCQTALSALPGCTDHCLCGVTLGALNSWGFGPFFGPKGKARHPMEQAGFQNLGNADALFFWVGETLYIIGL